MDRKGMEPSEQFWEVQDDTSAVSKAKSTGAYHPIARLRIWEVWKRVFVNNWRGLAFVNVIEIFFIFCDFL